MQGILNDKKREAKEGRNVSFQNSVDAEDDDEVLSNVEGETVHKQGGVLRSLILTPTRELAMQIKDHIQVDPFLNTGQKFLGVTSGAVGRGVGRGPDIPGSRLYR